jgi:hypothetical protein
MNDYIIHNAHFLKRARNIRNELLNKTDRYFLIDFPIEYEKQIIIKKYGPRPSQGHATQRAGGGTVCNVVLHPPSHSQSRPLWLTRSAPGPGLRCGWPGTDAPGAESTSESLLPAHFGCLFTGRLHGQWPGTRRPPRRHRDGACEEAAKVLWSPLQAVLTSRNPPF